MMHADCLYLDRRMRTDHTHSQMQDYWPKRFGTFVLKRRDETPADHASGSGQPSTSAAAVHADVPRAAGPSGSSQRPVMAAVDSDDSDVDDYDRHRAEAQANQADDGWREELDRYLRDPAIKATKRMDTVE